MKILFATGVAIVSVLTASSALSQPVNHAPVCSAKVLPANSPEGSYISSGYYSPVALEACGDEDGDALIVVSVSYPGSLSEDGQIIIPYPDNAGESISVSYTLTDGKGGEASSTITLQRN